ncbi:DUF2267 domain-containing protein [Cesiribacter andamanensis]|uniref:Uncharacterized protein n=1 Tax=Cesiribacter andamanensis AMV16 TaxID=1279009 RepID=M7N247_9BACT|nr:DUF2267 domain-containing protein [Cesiribacter andamanensis]EMR01387.1 hypothetical protein ADICEAN_03475 [Cesiribacter andamanensis AMV16]
MEYSQLLQSVQKLNFIKDKQMADEAIKCTLSNAISGLPEEDAREFVAPLPDPISYNDLQERQDEPESVSPQEHLQQLSSQLEVDQQQAEELVRNVFSLPLRSFEEEQREAWLKRLDKEWASFVRKFDRF